MCDLQTFSSCTSSVKKLGASNPSTCEFIDKLCTSTIINISLYFPCFELKWNTYTSLNNQFLPTFPWIILCFGEICVSLDLTIRMLYFHISKPLLMFPTIYFLIWHSCYTQEAGRAGSAIPTAPAGNVEPREFLAFSRHYWEGVANFGAGAEYSGPAKSLFHYIWELLV